MNLLEFKDELSLRYTLVTASMLYSFQKETAYFINNWASLLSTTFYTLSMLLFITIIYGNVKMIAGYTKNDMLLFFLVGQVAYYITATMSYEVMDDLIVAVNRGDLDLILTKPLPSLFYLTFRQIKVVSTLRDGIPPTLAIIFAIKWSEFHFSLPLFLLGVIVFISGLVSLHAIQFLSVVPVFWLGESKRILKVVFSVYSSSGTNIPLEGMIPSLKILLSTVIPVLLVTAFTTSILLQKSRPYPLVILSMLVSIVFLIIMQSVWRLALKHYTSASS